MSKVVFITPEDSRYGFGLAGAEQVITAAVDCAQTLSQVVDNPAVGLIFLDERLHQHLDKEWLANLEKHWPGMLVVLPAPEKLAEPEKDYAMQLIVKAIGYQVRL